MSDEEYDQGGSGASETFPKQCSAFRKNEVILIKDHPCKIVEMSTSKTGKHGHAKVHLVGIDVFTGKKYEDICPSTHNMSAVRMTNKEYCVVGIDVDADGKPDYFQVVKDDGEQYQVKYECGDPKEAKTKEELDAMIEEGLMVSTRCAMGQEKMTGIKKST